MAIRSNHYDAAFEEFLRARCVPYVAVDEKRRALLADSSIKSFDFIVEADGPNLLVDVKGRLWGTSGVQAAGVRTACTQTAGSQTETARSKLSHPQSPRRRPQRASNRYWENWATEDDIASMLRWEDVFGDQFRAALVFAYAVEAGVEIPALSKRDGAELFQHDGRTYFFSAVTVRDYAFCMKPRSAGWGTVTIAAADYREHRQPFERLLVDAAVSRRASA